MKFCITREKINKKEIKKFFKFLILGLPSFSLAILINIFFVKYLMINKSVSYGLITLAQIITNFYLINKYIFNPKRYKSKVIIFVLYAFGILIVRTFDWLIYTKLIDYFPNSYIKIQILNTSLFSILKFKYFKYIMD